MHRRTRRTNRVVWATPLLAALTVCLFAGLVAASGVLATAGGRDQRDFHWPTVLRFQDGFPRVDIVNVQTATAPLYHLAVAAVSSALRLHQGGAQFVAALFAATLAAVVVRFAAKVTEGWLAVLTTLPLLLSPYFWQSALWMLNDAAALLFGFLAFAIVLRQTTCTQSQLIVGTLLACAVATRQTYIWAVVPVVAVTILQTRGRPRAYRIGAVVRVVAPALVVTTALVVLWRGLVPPSFHQINADTHSWVALSYGFAVAAMFLTPVLIASTRHRRPARYVSLCAAIAAALPALIFPSVATVLPNDQRRGGVIWSLISHGPALMDRSLVLAAVAALGAWVICQLVVQLPRPTGLLLVFGVISLAVTLSAGGQLYQKYFELPIAALTVITVWALISNRQLARTWPLVLLAAAQLTLTAGIVAIPFIHGLAA